MFRLLFVVVLFGALSRKLKTDIFALSRPSTDTLSTSVSPPGHHRTEWTLLHTSTRTKNSVIMKHKRVQRGTKDAKSKQRVEQQEHQDLRPFDPDGYFTTPKVFNGSLLVHNPLYPVTGETYKAYAVMLLALMVFAVGAVANLAVSCAVWHNHYLQNARNCVLASLALWDLALIFFCLPVVAFHELTKRRLMGDLSCRLVPFLEVASLGISTFSLCALSIDRFQTLTSSTSVSPTSKTQESFGSILSKLSVIWLGSLLLSAPELMIWHLETELAQVTRLPVDSCIRLPPPSPPFSESVYSLLATYHESRMWWLFGCFFCLPLLFSLSCQLLTSQISDQAVRPSSSSTKLVMMLTIAYGVFSLPEHAWNIGLTYAGLQVDPATLALLVLIGQFLMFARASATPILILSSCRTLGQSFLDCCCCCCCDECVSKRPQTSSSSSSSSSSTSSSSVLEKKKKLQVELDKKIKENALEMAIGTPC